MLATRTRENVSEEPRRESPMTSGVLSVLSRMPLIFTMTLGGSKGLHICHLVHFLV